MPIYKVAQKGVDQPRLVKAESQAQAVRHCAKDVFAAETVSKVEDAADLFAAGVKLETAGAEPAAEPEPQQPDGSGDRKSGDDRVIIDEPESKDKAKNGD